MPAIVVASPGSPDSELDSCTLKIRWVTNSAKKEFSKGHTEYYPTRACLIGMGGVSEVLVLALNRFSSFISSIVLVWPC